MESVTVPLSRMKCVALLNSARATQSGFRELKILEISVLRFTRCILAFVREAAVKLSTPSSVGLWRWILKNKRLEQSSLKKP